MARPPFLLLPLLPLLLSLFLFLFLPACSKPKPPQITVKSGQITRIDPQGIELLLHLDAFNPNGYALSVRGISASVLVDGRLDLGKVTIERPVSIPAGQRVPIDAPIASRWNDLPSIALLAASNRTVPYTVKGTVTLGGESLSVDVPYAFDGVITHEQIVHAALGSIPKLPGVKLP
jgi:LEA14-like dessication related protein